jgi:distribution and morphology protein 31
MRNARSSCALHLQPWSSDHRFAIASWGVVGGVWWIIAGTSTFLSLLIWAIPSKGFQEWVAAKVSEHVTRYTGATVSFGSAIQPTWRTLRFNNVRIVRTRAMCGIPNVME